MKKRLQVCVDCVESAINAEKAGATDIELCGNLHIGGTTPSVSLYKEVRKNISLPIYVLLRPRYGNFIYDKYEMNIMSDEAKIYSSEGANGLVAGALTEDGNFDFDFLKKLIDISVNTPIAVHRAFDCCKDAIQTYKNISKLGCKYILTTGQKNNVIDGIELLDTLNKSSGIEIVVGCSNAEKLEIIMKKTEIKSFHLSGKMLEKNIPKYCSEVEFSVSEACGNSKIVTDKEKILSVAKRLFS